MQLIKSLKAYIIYANIGKDYHSFVYNILPGKDHYLVTFILMGKMYLVIRNMKSG